MSKLIPMACQPETVILMPIPRSPREQARQFGFDSSQLIEGVIGLACPVD
jgi:hypothetical protein